LMVTAALWGRLRADSGRFAAVTDTDLEGFDSVDTMNTLIFGRLLADTTAR